eukprot:393513-Rhodomonas_salina.1
MGEHLTHSSSHSACVSLALHAHTPRSSPPPLLPTSLFSLSLSLLLSVWLMGCERVLVRNKDSAPSVDSASGEHGGR